MKGTTKEITSHDGAFFDFLRPLMSARIPSMKNLPTPLAKIVLVPFELMAEASVIDAAVKNIFLDQARLHSLIPLNEEMGNIMKAVKSLEKLGLLIKGITKIVQNKTKEQKLEFLDMLLGTLAAHLLRNILAGTEVIKGGDGVIRASKG